MPILITPQKDYYGSVIYEELGADHLTLEFYTSKLDRQFKTNAEEDD